MAQVPAPFDTLSEANAVNLNELLSRPGPGPFKGVPTKVEASQPLKIAASGAALEAQLLMTDDSLLQTVSNDSSQANSHRSSFESPKLDTDSVKAILSLTGSRSCCGLSKATCMSAWKTTQIATWLIARHGLHSALMIAASNGLVKVCNALLTRPKQPAKANDQDSAALKAAAGNGHLDVCHLLLQQSSNTAHADDGDSAALRAAAEKGHLEVCQLLLGLQHRPAKANDRSSAALQAAAGRGSLDICRVLLQQRSNPARADDADSAALQAAAGNGHLQVCEVLLQHGARADDAGSWALREAATSGHLAVCQMLLSQKKRPARADARESAPLQNAAAQGHLDVCKLLLEWKDQPARADAKDSSALRYAAAGGHVAVCELLLSQKQHPARPDDWNSAPLRDAAANGHVAVCKLLLAYKAHPARAYDLDNDGLTFVSSFDVNAAQLLKLREESSRRESQCQSFTSDCAPFTPIASLPLPSVCETDVACDELPPLVIPQPIKEATKYPAPLPPVVRSSAARPKRRQTSWFSCF